MSHRTLRQRKKLPQASGPWCLDSGGFSELSMNGKWVTTVDEYLEAIERYLAIGQLQWAAPMDWMCEPHMIALTGLSIEEHQHRTVENYLELTSRAPHLPIIPVLQGWELGDYIRCVVLYRQAGVDLRTLPTVGVGSVCRRQSSASIGRIMGTLAGMGLALHGFGVKKQGLAMYGQHLASADSMAWSFRARRSAPLPGCTHKNCANCLEFALKWRRELLVGMAEASVARRRR